MSQAESSSVSSASVPSRFAVPPWSLVVIAVTSVQIGAAIAKQLFETTGPGGAVFLRTFLAALLFLALWRPRLRSYTRRQATYMILYGVIIALNMLVFYAAIQRVPLGITVAIAFAGPLGVAVWNSRKALDLVWIALAGIGILLLSPFTDANLDLPGMALVVLTAVLWASYVILTKRTGTLLQGNEVLAIGMCVAALVALPFGITGAVKVLSSPSLIFIALVVALLSSALPFGLEFVAMKRLPSYTFSLLLSLEPVMAAVVGWLLLHEALDLREIIGIALVTVAAAATARSG